MKMKGRGKKKKKKINGEERGEKGKKGKKRGRQRKEGGYKRKKRGKKGLKLWLRKKMVSNLGGGNDFRQNIYPCFVGNSQTNKRFPE